MLTSVRTISRARSQGRKSRLLHALDCDETQDFLFGKPVPSEAFEERYLVSVALA
jgi:EAL domain-containing protein (putative c-di-GMP-specific phosphodiesterase class I)